MVDAEELIRELPVDMWERLCQSWPHRIYFSNSDLTHFPKYYLFFIQIQQVLEIAC